MTAIFGWFGGQPDIDQASIRRMAGMPDAAGREARFLACKLGAVGTSAAGGSTGMAFRDGCVVAISGHPRLEGASVLDRTLNELCTNLIIDYRQHGTEALARLRGDFSLALLDDTRGYAFLAIDRIGVRPLIYQTSGKTLIFGSTSDYIVRHPEAGRELDAQSIYDYVYFHMVPSPGTMYRNQRRLLPGSFAEFCNGRLSEHGYWKLKFEEASGGDVETFKAPFLELLEASVRRASAGVETGAFLSGGTDSSTISGMLAKASGVSPSTFSIGFDAEGYDEMEYARIAASHFGTLHHEYYVTPDDVVEAIPRIAAIYDQPFGNASAVPTYYCARLASENGVARLLGGDGGDELFGGNARYAKQQRFALYERLPILLRKGAIEPLLGAIPGGDRIPGIRQARSYVRHANMTRPARYERYNLLERLGKNNVFTREFLSGVNVQHPLGLVSSAWDGTGAASLINQMLAVDIRFILADSDLPKVTRMCELANIDVVFPMLDDEVVAFSATLPPRLKLNGMKLRYFFKEALRDFLPREVITKSKHGFGLPVGDWMLKHPPLAELATSSLEGLAARGIIQRSFVEDLMTRRLPMVPSYYGTMAWVLMMLELWFRRH